MTLAISVPLAILVSIVSLVGIMVPGFYWRESANWQMQTYGQDLVDLFVVVPALLLTAALSLRSSGVWRFVWGGVLAYIAYTFVIYSFNIHFNLLFLPYCFALGLSLYGIFYLTLTGIPGGALPPSGGLVEKITAIYFLVISAAFYSLWLMEILPAQRAGVTPRSLAETGLVSNPVYILDLSVVLPGIFISGLLLLRKQQAGLKLALTVLTFFILMDITIGSLTWLMQHKLGIPGQGLIYVMLALTGLSVCLLTVFMRRNRKGAV